MQHRDLQGRGVALHLGDQRPARHMTGDLEVDPADLVDGKARQQGVAELRAQRIADQSLYHGVVRKLRSEEHTSELQSLMRISYAVFCLKKQKRKQNTNTTY